MCNRQVKYCSEGKKMHRYNDPWIHTIVRLVTVTIATLVLTGWNTAYVLAYEDGDVVTGVYVSDLLDPVVVPNDAYDGTPGSMASSTILITEDDDGFPVSPGHMVADLSVKLWMSSDFLGDLTIKLKHEDTMVCLLNRPGITGIPDDGTIPGGNGANLSFDFPITFTDDEMDWAAELMGSDILGHQVVGDPSNGSSDTYFPYGDGVEPELLSTFIGSAASGEWTLFIGDSSPNAPTVPVAELQNWSITMDRVIPEPSSCFMLGSLAVLLLQRVRRCRN